MRKDIFLISLIAYGGFKVDDPMATVVRCLLNRSESHPICHVLIIEDEPLVALSLEDLRTDAGATSFDIANTERDAVAAATARPPAFITSDVRLVEETGPRAVRTIRKLIGNIPVIFITGTPDELANPVTLPARTRQAARRPRYHHSLSPSPAKELASGVHSYRRCRDYVVTHL